MENGETRQEERAYGIWGLRRRGADLFFRAGAFGFSGTSCGEGGVIHAPWLYYGPGANGEYYAIRDVPVSGKSCGGIGHGGGFRGFDPDALYSYDTRSMDSGFADSSHRREAGPDQ